MARALNSEATPLLWVFEGKAKAQVTDTLDFARQRTNHGLRSRITDRAQAKTLGLRQKTLVTGLLLLRDLCIPSSPHLCAFAPATQRRRARRLAWPGKHKVYVPSDLIVTNLSCKISQGKRLNVFGQEWSLGPCEEANGSCLSRAALIFPWAGLTRKDRNLKRIKHANSINTC